MTKKIILTIILLCFTFNTVSFGLVERSVQQEFYVDVNGSDDNSGSNDRPFQTIERARQEVQKYNRDMQGDIVVNIRPGRYELAQTLQFTKEDSGSNGFRVIYRGERDKVPTLSGARQVTGWKEDDDGIWSAYAPQLETARELYVNETPAVRARSTKKLFGNANYIKPGSSYVSDGFYVDRAKLPVYNNPKDVELHWSVTWKSYLMHVQDIIEDPNNAAQNIVVMDDAAWHGIAKTPVTVGGFPRYDIGFIVENAYELLDEPGEFYYDKATKILHYMPRDNEDMSTAEVLCPQIDQLIYIAGLEYDNKVSNIHFEDLRFAHSTWKLLDIVHFGTNQGESPQMPGVGGRATPGSVEITWADGISIEACQFFGMATVGLSLVESVTNSRFNGNVFTDIGCAAFVAGRSYHTRFEAPQHDGPGNVFFRKAWLSSNNYNENINYFQNFFHYNLENEFDGSFPGLDSIWYSAPEAEEKGVKSWVRADLRETYSIDHVKLSFKNIGNLSISGEQRSNFEVLASNDEDFATYEQLAVVGRNLRDEVIVRGVSDAKYRYIMLRKTNTKPFAIKNIGVYSYDRKPLGERGVCVNNTFTNNYISRIGTINLSSCAVLAYYTDNLQISNNEIYGVPYTGISMGWGWANVISTTAKNNRVTNNIIDGFTREANDGGGIYTLGYLPGTVINGNYILNQGNLYAGIYTDEGTAHLTIKDNVLQNVANPMFVWRPTINNLHITNTWTDAPYTMNDGTDVYLEPVRHFTSNNPPPEAAKIIHDAGITPEYRFVLERTPIHKSTIISGPDSLESFLKVKDMAAPAARLKLYIDMMNHLLKSGKFGNLPGQYSYESKYELLYLIDRIKSTENKVSDKLGGHVEEYSMIVDAVNRAISSIHRLSFMDMLELCVQNAEQAQEGQAIGMYPKGALEQFRTLVGEVKERKAIGSYEQYVALWELEQGYNALEKARYSADVEFVFVEDGKTMIDRENKLIKVIVPANYVVEACKPVFEVSEGSKLSVDITKLDYSSQVTIPVYNAAVKQYAYWKFIIVREEPRLGEETKVSAKAENWNSTNQTSPLLMRQGTLTLQPWHYPYMYTDSAFEGKIDFEARIDVPDSKAGVNFLFAAKDTEQLELDGLYLKNTYFKLSLLGQRMVLYGVEAGRGTIYATADHVDFLYGRKNHISIKTGKENDRTRIQIFVNGELKLDNLSTVPFDLKGYFGIYTPNTKCIIFESVYPTLEGLKR